MSDATSIADFVAGVAATNQPASGGAVAAHTAALCGALAQMVSDITVGRKRYASVDTEMRALSARAAELVRSLSALADADATACAAMHQAYRLPHETADQSAFQAREIARVMLHATEVPLEIARCSAEACRLAVTAAEKGNSNATADATVAALLADASCRGAAFTVRLNATVLDDQAVAARYVTEAMGLARQTVLDAARATEQAERAIEAAGRPASPTP